MKRQGHHQQVRSARLSLYRQENERRRKIVRKAKRLRRAILLAERRYYAARDDIFFDPVLGREQVILPEVLSLKENYTETVDALLAIRRSVFVARRPVMVHFEKVTSIEPGAAIALVAELFRIRKLVSPTAATGTYPRQRVVYDLLIEMGFYNLLQVEELYGPPSKSTTNNRPIFLKFLTDKVVDAALVDNFVSIIEQTFMPMNEVARGKLVAAIIEAMNNTLDHAHTSPTETVSMTNRWWLSSWLNVIEREIMIMVFDQGIGIPQSLRPTRYEQVRAAVSNLTSFRSLSSTPSDGELIMAATELYRTSTGQDGRGKGFRNMKQFVDACQDGELRVLSNRGTYAYMGGTDVCANESLSIGGTLIEWRFRHEGSVEMDDD